MSHRTPSPDRARTMSLKERTVPVSPRLVALAVLLALAALVIAGGA